jgi:hypothetical protein
MSISRAELTEEFFDRTSAKLLAQPEPQYPYAMMFKNALGIRLGAPAMIGRAGQEVGGQGPAYSNPERDRLDLMSGNTISTEVFATQMNFVGEPGHTVRFNRPKFTDTTYTQAAREIGVNQTISTVPITAGSEQTSLTIRRFAGPYDGTNSRVAPFALDAFDATMGVHNLVTFVGTQLQRDFDKTIDSFWVTLADLASTTVYPYNMTADNDATAKAQFPLTYEQISRTSKKQDEANLPTFGDGRRLLVVTPTGKKQLKDDPQFARYAEFHRDMNPLFPGWFATCPEYHVAVSNTLTKSSNSSSINIHYGHAIAPGAFLGGSGKPPKVAAASDDNYGETPKVIWLAFLALGLADNRFVTSVRYTEDVS